jgi:hypothetical protein
VITPGSVSLEDDRTVVRACDDEAAGLDGARMLAILDQHDVGSADGEGCRMRQQVCAGALDRLDQRTPRRNRARARSDS